MSCPTATAPIDISSANIAGKCDLKCAYQFKYTSSSCTATNRGHYLSLAGDRGSSTSPPVHWNQNGYSVDEVRLYTPSLHSFGGTRAAGEVVILHVSNTGSRPLFVCIPVQIGGGAGAGSAALHSVLSAVAKNAPADGDSTAVRVTGSGGGGGFNLSNWVPTAPFYSYTATEPFQPCSGEVDYVVFDAGSSPLYVSDADMSLWSDVVKPHPYDIKPVAGAGAGGGSGGVQLFYNSKGPNQGGAANDDEIYIDCQPVGESQETKWVSSGGGSGGAGSSGGESGWKWGNLLENQYVQLALCVLGFFVLLFGMRWLLDWVGSQMPTVGAGGGGGREGESWLGWVRAT